MKQLLVWCLFRSWMLFMQMMIKCLSFHQAQLFFNVLAKYLFVCLPKKNKAIAHKNLSLVYSDLTHEAREQHIKRNLGDFLMMPYYIALSFYGAQKRIDAIEKKGFAPIKKWADQGERIIVIIPHWQSMELSARIISVIGLGRFCGLTKPRENEKIEGYIQKNRQLYCHTIGTHDIKSACKHLKQPGSILGVLPDQYYGKGPKTTFMGVETRRTDSVARMANRFKAKVVFAHMYLQADQQCITLEPLKAPLTGDIAKDHQAIFDQMGDLVLTNPDHYMLWMNKTLFKDVLKQQKILDITQ